MHARAEIRKRFEKPESCVQLKKGCKSLICSREFHWDLSSPFYIAGTFYEFISIHRSFLMNLLGFIALYGLVP